MSMKEAIILALLTLATAAVAILFLLYMATHGYPAVHFG